MRHGLIHDFILDLSSAGQDYAVRVSCPSLAGDCEPQELSRYAVRQVVKDGLAIEAQDALDIRRAAWLGTNLFELVFSGESRGIWETASNALQAGEFLRILVQLPMDSELHDVPWELLCVAHRFLALQGSMAVVRYIRQGRPVGALRVSQPPLRILLTSASPSGLSPILYEEEVRCLEKALRPARREVELFVEHGVSFSRLKRLFHRFQDARRPIHLWHHCGHGLKKRGQFHLVLENAGPPEFVSAAKLGDSLKRQPHLRTAVLNTCFAGSRVGLARQLAGLGLGLVVGFRSQVYEDSARLFASSFYRNLLEWPADHAAQLARESLQTHGQSPIEWAQLLVFSRTTDARLLAAVPRAGGMNQSQPNGRHRARASRGR